MYAEITPHHLAALSVRRAADALEQTEADPTTWFFVILDLHRALYCALIAAPSGAVGIGAYPDKNSPALKMPRHPLGRFRELLKPKSI
jgi:hypothetical protein